MTTDERAARSPASATPSSGSTMRARRWAIAAAFRTPADYDIPELPDWTVYRYADGSLALGSRGEVFIRAGDPVRVRR